MNNFVIIRQETEKDFEQVLDVIRLAFQNMDDSDHKEHLLVQRLRQSDSFIPQLSLLAETDNGKIVGHILLSEVKVVSEKTVWPLLAVAPLSVLPEFQRKGIGGMLIHEAHIRASTLGYGAAILLGHKDYYPRFGYRKASLFGIKLPFDAPDECCMVMELREGGLDGVHGLVCYPDVFFQVDP